MAEELLSVSFATSSVLEEETFECGCALPEAEDSCDKFYSEVIYDVNAQRANGYYLPVTLATSVASLPADVALWLIELRHCKESTDIVHDVIQQLSHASNSGSRSSSRGQSESAFNEIDDLPENSNNFEDPSRDEILDNLHSKCNIPLNISDDGLNNKPFQIWEGLCIPRLSLIPATSRGNFNPELGFGGGVSECMSGMARSQSFWEENPLYSTGSLQNDGSVSEKSINDQNEWVSCNTDFTTLDGHNRQHYDLQHQRQWVDLNRDKSIDGPTYSSQTRHEGSQSASVEALTERPSDMQDSETLGTVLSCENNYNVIPSPKERTNKANATCAQEKKLKREPSELHIKCENILNNLDHMIEKFEGIKKVFLANDENIEDVRDDMFLRDNEFVEMCESADYIIEETLKCHSSEKQAPPIPFCSTYKLNERVNPLNRTSTDSNDEVFLSEEVPNRKQVQEVNMTPIVGRKDSYNINEIFDKREEGNGDKPVPPARKKKLLLSQDRTLSNIERKVDEIIGLKCNDHQVQPSTAFGGNSTAQEVGPPVNATNNSYYSQDNVVVARDDTADERRETTITRKNTETLDKTGNSVTECKKEPNIFRISTVKMQGITVDESCPKNSTETSFPKAASNLSEMSRKPPLSDTNQAPNTLLASEKQKPVIHEKQTEQSDEKRNVVKDGKQRPLILEERKVQVAPREKQRVPPIPEKRSEPTYVNWNRENDSKVKKPPVILDSSEEAPEPKIRLTQTIPISSSTFPSNDSQSKYSVAQQLRENIAPARPKSKSPSKSPTLHRMSTFQQPSNVDPSVRTNSNKVNSLTRRSMPHSIGLPEITHKSLSSLTTTTQSYNMVPSSTSNTSIKSDQVWRSVQEEPAKGGRAAPSALLATTAPPTSTARQEQELLERTRKGSTSSDVAAWKETLSRSTTYYHDDEMDPKSMPSNEWFSSNASGLLSQKVTSVARQVPDINVTPAAVEPNTITKSQTQSAPKRSVANITKLIEAELRDKSNGQRDGKSKSLVLTTSTGYNDEKNDTYLLNTINWTDFWNENKTILREGILSRTKLTENGKKVRKNWVTSYVVLTEPFLLVFKDVKTFNAMKISTETFSPEMCVDLCGAYVEKDEKLSSRKNVYTVSTIHGLQVLLQAPSYLLLNQWFQSTQAAIASLPGHDTCPRIIQGSKKEASSPLLATTPPDQKLHIKPMSRTKSIKITNNESNEDLTASVEERQTKTRARLKKFFNRRPSKESLVKKGIYKDEPMFGCNLSDVVPPVGPCIPQFVLQCIQAIESKRDNMKTDGLYRASGNLSQVQKIRLQVDQNKLGALEEEEDVHVLTGVLKLFFRELKRPLIPFEQFSRAIAAGSIPNQKERVQKFRELVRDLPPPNHDTLDYLLQHLLRVTQNKEFNRMHIPNIAIVFGPTLMRPEEESLNMALDLMKQNSVIECLLSDYKQIFC